jgi:hypothetical protein
VDGTQLRRCACCFPENHGIDICSFTRCVQEMHASSRSILGTVALSAPFLGPSKRLIHTINVISAHGIASQTPAECA